MGGVHYPKVDKVLAGYKSLSTDPAKSQCPSTPPARLCNKRELVKGVSVDALHNKSDQFSISSKGEVIAKKAMH